MYQLCNIFENGKKERNWQTIQYNKSRQCKVRKRVELVQQHNQFYKARKSWNIHFLFLGSHPRIYSWQIFFFMTKPSSFCSISSSFNGYQTILNKMTHCLCWKMIAWHITCIVYLGVVSFLKLYMHLCILHIFILFLFNLDSLFTHTHISYFRFSICQFFKNDSRVIFPMLVFLMTKEERK